MSTLQKVIETRKDADNCDEYSPHCEAYYYEEHIDALKEFWCKMIGGGDEQ